MMLQLCKIGHVRDVCQSNPIIRKDERQEQMLVDLTRQLRDSIWRAESDQLNYRRNDRVCLPTSKHYIPRDPRTQIVICPDMQIDFKM